MAFRVEVSPRAFRDLDEIAGFIETHGSFQQAEEWFNGIMAAIRTLEMMPDRCRVADVSSELGQEVRMLLYGKRRLYRVYYSVQHRTRTTGTVRVFHVRHWARESLDARQLGTMIRDEIL